MILVNRMNVHCLNSQVAGLCRCGEDPALRTVAVVKLLVLASSVKPAAGERALSLGPLSCTRTQPQNTKTKIQPTEETASAGI